MTDTTVSVAIQGGTLIVDQTTLQAAIAQALSTASFTPTPVPAPPPVPVPPPAPAPPTPTPVPTPTPTPAPTTNKAAILSWLNGLTARTDKRFFVGQTTAIWNKPLTDVNVDEAPINAVKAITGKSVAAVATIQNFATNSYAIDPSVAVAEVAEYLSQGYLVQVSLYWNMPASGGPQAPQSSSWDAADFHAAVTPGTPQYKTLTQVLFPQQIAGLKAIIVKNPSKAILLRPFIEINGSWNWYGAESGSDMIALWLLFWNACDAAGLTPNLIWVWNINDNVGSYSTYYPGTNQVDVVGLDVYATQSELPNYINTAYQSLLAHKKPLILSEYGGADNAPSGNGQLDNTALLSVVKSTFPAIVGAFWFNGTWSLASNNNTAALISDPWAITLADLPANI